MAITKAEKYRYNNNTFEISVLLKWIWILIKIIGEFLKVRRRKNINKYVWIILLISLTKTLVPKFGIK